MLQKSQVRRHVVGAALLGLGLVLAPAACRESGPRSLWSFQQICSQIEGLSARQVAERLGEPDTRQVVFDGDQRWIWWNFTFLEGPDYPPELRDSPVHLEIVFKNPHRGNANAAEPADWQIDEPYGVTFRLPMEDAEAGERTAPRTVTRNYR